MHLFPVNDSNVKGWIKLAAFLVIRTWTSACCFFKALAREAALYAAILPVTPKRTVFSRKHMPFLFSQFFLFQNTKKIAFRKEFLFQYTIKYHQRKQGSPLILALDVGNTNIVLGCLTEEQVCFTSRLSTDRNKTVSEYAVLIQDICRLYQVHTQQIRGGIISSVVPEISEVLQEAVRHLTGKMPLLVGPDLLPYLAVEMDNPKQLGSDLRVDAIAAIQEYPPPILIIDMGTATTVSVIDAQKRYLGGMIIPGVRLALDALSNQTSQLPHISLDKPERLIGKKHSRMYGKRQCLWKRCYAGWDY